MATKPRKTSQAAYRAAQAMQGDLTKPPPFIRDDGPNGKRRKRTKKRSPQFDSLVREFGSKKDATYSKG